MSGETPSPRLLPCESCGFDLRGRVVGETCPECGSAIDTPGPRWCTERCLGRLARMARLARIPCLLLLAVPVLFLLGIAGAGGSDRVWIATLIAFLVLMPLQVVTQAVAVWRMAMPELGETRVRRLRLAMVARIAAFGSALGLIVVDAVSPAARSGAFDALFIAGYCLAPLVAIGSDFVTLGALGSLRRESGALVSGWHAVMPPLARWGLLGVYPLVLVPFIGWFFAPIFWTVAMSIGFAQVGAVARQCQARAIL